MEINFENKNIKAYKEIFYQTKYIQELSETVVPDTDEDIGKIASLQSSVLLKSKDITGRGVLVSGEAWASLLYINESQDKVSCIKLKKPFTIDYDIADIDPETIAQVQLSIVNAEARLINPRKVSVSFEIAGELCCYVKEAISIECGVPANVCKGLHVKYENADINIINGVCEKTFSLNEQFDFPGGKPKPVKLASVNADLVINDTQFIGTKAIVKGNAEYSLCYLSDEVNYPVKTEFTAAFSQIIDMGEESVDDCTLIPSITGLYYNIADSISGNKLVEIELHAVLQLVCRSSRQLVYIADAYSNLYPALCSIERETINHIVENRRIKMTGDERLSIDECTDVLSVFLSLAHLVQNETGIRATINVDVVFKVSGGQLSSARRNISIQLDEPAEKYRVNSARLADVYLRPDGQYLDIHLAVEMNCLVCASIELDKLCSVNLDEEKAIERDKFPTVTLVRSTGESLWELAKTYHSSVESISASNDMGKDLEGKMILVPKCI